MATTSRRMTPGTTVLVVAYNHANYVEETLESIAAQTVAPVRVLVADDASPGDDTAAVIKRWVDRAGGPFEFQPNEVNLGLNRTLNRLLKQVETEFVTYIAGDDTMAPQRLEIHEQLLRESSPDTVLAYSDATVIGPRSEVIHSSSRVEFPWPPEPRRSQDPLACLVEANWIPAASFFLRTSVLQDEGGYAEDLFYEDFELLTRLAARHRFTYTEEALVCVRRLETSLGAVGFAHDSPRFIKAMFQALLHAEHATSPQARQAARTRRWALTKRASKVGMPIGDILRMAARSWQGAATPVHAAAQVGAALARRVRPFTLERFR